MIDDNDDDDGGVVPHGRRFSLSDRGMAAMAESLLRHCCRCHRLRPLSGVALRRGGVRTTCDEVLSARGRGDFDIVTGELVGACRSSRPDNPREPLTRCCSSLDSPRCRSVAGTTLPSHTLGSLLHFAGWRLALLIAVSKWC